MIIVGWGRGGFWNRLLCFVLRSVLSRCFFVNSGWFRIARMDRFRGYFMNKRLCDKRRRKVRVFEILLFLL